MISHSTNNTASHRLGTLLLCLVLGVVLPGRVRAQTAVLSGTVRSHETSAALARATVRIQGTRLRAITDEAGRYRIMRVPAGTYIVHFSLLGQTARSESVRLEAGSEVVLDAELVAQPIALRPISVILDRTGLVGDPRRMDEIAGSAHYLSKAELEDRALLYDDIHGVLRRVPGVNIREEEGYGLRPNIGMRGTGTDRSSKITLMEDGVLIAPAPYAAPAAYYFPLVGRMEAVEVRKGSSQIKYGPRTIGGALNLVSSSIPDQRTVKADFEAGEHDTRKLTVMVGDSYTHFGWLAETYQIATNGFKHLDGGGSTGFDIEDFVVRFRVNTDPVSSSYQELEFKLGLYNETSDETYLGLTDEDFLRNPLRRYAASQEDVMNAEHTQVMARHFMRAVGNLDVTTTAYRNDFRRNWFKLQSVLGQNISRIFDNPGDFPAELAILRGAASEPDALKARANNREYYGQGVQSVIGLRVQDGTLTNDLELGVRYHEDQEDRFQHEDGFQMVDSTLVLTRRGTPGSQSNRVSDANAWAFFVQDRITLGKWMFSPGFRYETIRFTRTDYEADDPARVRPGAVSRNSAHALIPGVGVSYAMTSGLNVFGGVHRGFGPPGPGAGAQTEGEKSINYELGARYARDVLSVEVVGFSNDYSNILGRATLATGESGSGDVFNGGAVDAMGLEFSLAYDPVLRGGRGGRGGSHFVVPLRLAYTFTHAEFKSSFESAFHAWRSVEAGDALPYLPNHQAYASIGVKKSGWDATLTASYVNEMRTVAGQGPIPSHQGTDDFLVFSLSAEYEIAPLATFFVSAQNLTDQRYIVARHPAGARPGLPRTLLVGVGLGG